MNMVRSVRALRSLAIVGACLTMATLCACGGSVTTVASGKVTYKGAPLPSGTLTLYPASGPAYPINIHPDGTFSTSGIPVGEMGVGITTGMAGGMSVPPAGTDTSQMPKMVAIPPKYKDPKTSGLTWEIKGGTNTKDFDLTD